MIDLFREALAVQEFLAESGWPFCFIGGVALQHWGEPRVTRDLDLTVFAGFGAERAVEVEFVPGVALRICCAEDLLVLKAFADRPRDRADVLSIALRSGRAVDWGAVEARLAPLAQAKGDASILDRVREIRREFGD